MLEVCLRNKLDHRMGAQYGVDWFKTEAAPLQQDGRQAIEDATYEAQKGRQDLNSDDVIAELPFNFWVGLLAPRYSGSLWRTTLYKAFRASPGGTDRGVVHGRLNALRRFRNRIAHHEPIFHRDLAKTHAEIVEAIGWMCRDSCSWTEHQSRVLAVLAGP